MPDEDRLRVAAADQRVVVVDDLGESESGELLGARAQLLDVAVLARPLRRLDAVAALLEVLREVLPAPCREPRAVGQDVICHRSSDLVDATTIRAGRTARQGGLI